MRTIRVYDSKGKRIAETQSDASLNEIMAYAERVRDGERFECLEPCEPNRDYGYGPGLSPVMVGDC